MTARADLLDAPPVRGGRVSRLKPPVDVALTARWSDGMTQELVGTATHWTDEAVFVSWYGARYGGQTLAWMPAVDVRRA